MNSVKDKDRFQTFNRSIKALLHVGRGSHTVNRDRETTATTTRLTKGPSFQSYITADKERDEDSGESPRESPSESPQERRKSGNPRLKAREVVLENETSNKGDMGRDGPVRRVSSSGDSDSMGELVSSHGSFGSGGMHHRATSYGGRSDSFGRNMRPGYPLRRHNSNESVSSQSTLVPRVPFYEAEDIGIVDMIRPEAERGGLTMSRINALQRSENLKHRYGGGGPSSYRRLHPDAYDYDEKLRVKEQRRRGRGSDGQETPDDDGRLSGWAYITCTRYHISC